MISIIKKTKAAILTKTKKPLVIDTIFFPKKLKKGQIIIKMIYSGVCGSQLGEIDAVKGKDEYLPHLLGHEGIGEVIQRGPLVKKVKKGDLALLHWMPSNGINSETPKFSWNKKVLNAGYVTTFSDYTIVSENRITKIKKKSNLLNTLLLGCTASTAIGSVEKLCDIKKTNNVIVAGCGPIGLYIIKYLNHLNIKNIIALDINKQKLELAKKFGAKKLIFNLKKNKIKKIDYFFECTGNNLVISDGYNTLNYNGTMIFIGVPNYKKKSCFNTLGINLGKKLIGSKGGNFKANIDLKKYLKIINKSKLRNNNFITKIIKLEKINSIFDSMRKNKTVGKIIIKF